MLGAWLELVGRILLVAWTIHGRSSSSWHGSRTTLLAWTTWPGCVGRMVSCVRSVPRAGTGGPRHRPDTRNHPANAARPGSPGKQCRPGTMPGAAGTSVDSPRHQQDAPDQLQPYTKHTLLKQICSTLVRTGGEPRGQATWRVRRAELSL